MLDSNLEVEKVFLLKTKRFLIGFVFAFILLIILSLLVFFPKENIIIGLSPEPFVENFPIKISLNTDIILYELGIIPGKLVSSKDTSKDYVYLEELALPNGKILSFRKSDIEKFLKFKIEEKLQNKKKIVESSNSFINYKVKSFDKDKITAMVDIFTKQLVVYNYSCDYIKSKISRERKIENIKEILSSLPGVVNVEIKNWQGCTPFLKNRIRVKFVIIDNR
ncbi:hypothetical protein J7K86_00575 [bacterium]|nr:hypothetical protein [bacterium]